MYSLSVRKEETCPLIVTTGLAILIYPHYSFPSLVLYHSVIFLINSLWTKSCSFLILSLFQYFRVMGFLFDVNYFFYKGIFRFKITRTEKETMSLKPWSLKIEQRFYFNLFRIMLNLVS